MTSYHTSWHDLIQTYIEASGIAWSHIHPNVISDTVLVTNAPITEIGSFSVSWCEAKQGRVFAEDIGAIVAAVLREASGREIKCNVLDPSNI